MRRIIFVLLALGIVLVYFRWPDRNRSPGSEASRAELTSAEMGNSVQARDLPGTEESVKSSVLAEPDIPLNGDDLFQEVRTLMDSRELSANEKFSRLWGKYERHAKDPVIASFLLDTMQFIKLQDKNQVVALLEASLARNAYDDAVKRSLIGLLAAQFQRDQSISRDAELRIPDNQRVIAALRKAADSPDPAIARPATLEYSRIGEPWEGVELLRTARQKALIDTTEYVRELAFDIPSFTDPAKQRELLSAIEEAGAPKQELADIMATMAQLPLALASLSPDTLLSVRRMLEAAPPQFGKNLGSLDVLAQAHYNIWAEAHSMITSMLDGKPVPELLVDLAMAPDADPHALVAVVTSSRSDAVLDTLAQRGLADEVRSKLDKFRLAHPNDAEASGVASGIQALLAQRAHANARRTHGN